MGLRAIIPVAGKGVRAHPATHYVPKALLSVAGKPIIVRSIEMLRDQLGVRDITIVLGHLGDQIRAALGTGETLGVRLDYLVCDEPTVGLAWGILPAVERMSEPFVVVLGDEVYLDSDHSTLSAIALDGALAACGVIQGADKRVIRKNYSVDIADGRIVELQEKPPDPRNDLLGVGTYLFDPRLGDWIRKAPRSVRTGQVELMEVLQAAIAAGERVLPAPLHAKYFNINSVEDYNDSNYAARNLRFDAYRISVIIPAYNEEDTLGYVIDDFRPLAHEVFVVDNSSRDRTAAVAHAHGARVETVSLKGYGDTIKYGLDNAGGDILVIVEADHSFRAKDLGKLLEYLKDADMAIGTRTTRQLVEQGANMRGLLRWGNVAVGKLVEALWWGQQPRFTDVGCTYRGIWKEFWLKIRDRMEGTGPEFSPEMMIEVLRARGRVVEIPVSYYPRAGGESKHSESYRKISYTALRMLRTIFRKRFLTK